MKRTRVTKLIIPISLFSLLTVAAAAYGLELPEIHGFIQGNYTPRVSGSPDDDFILAEERLQLEAEHFGDALNSRGFFKIDFFHDAVDGDADLEVREALVDFSLGKFDFRVGRQIITWGLGDLIFINDAFPKDFAAFFSGRPPEYLKIPSDAVRISFFPEQFSADLVIVPFFEPDNLPDGKRLLFFDPLATVPNRRATEPEDELDNTEVAFRLQKNVLNYDMAIYAFRGFFKQPGARLISADTVELFFPRLNIYGFSSQGAVRGGVGKLEFGYYDSADDLSGADPTIENSSLRFMLAYEREWLTDLTIGVQYFARWMLRYDDYRATLPPGIPAQDEFRMMNTMRVTYFLLHQTLRLSLFYFFSSTDGDFYVIPEIKYYLTDQLSVTLGANVFGGKREHTFFGQLDKNDNIYTIIKYNF